jgi:hypothetical protein
LFHSNFTRQQARIFILMVDAADGSLMAHERSALTERPVTGAALEPLFTGMHSLVSLVAASLREAAQTNLKITHKKSYTVKLVT